MTKTIALPALPETNFSIKFKHVIFVALVMGLLMVMAHAGGDATAVDEVWDQLSSWAKGAPGKIIALLSFMSAIWFGIVKPNYTNAIGSLLVCLLMANATDIIENFLAMSL